MHAVPEYLTEDVSYIKSYTNPQAFALLHFYDMNNQYMSNKDICSVRAVKYIAETN